MPVSVLTVARGKPHHLRNLVMGLMRQIVLPDELLIGVMQEDLYLDLPDTPFRIQQIRIPGDELPLARARNTLARFAGSEALIFLDQDCVPGPCFVADHAKSLARWKGVVVGEVNFLEPDALSTNWTCTDLETKSAAHPDRLRPPAKGLRPEPDFCILNFAIRRKTFLKIGGFDLRFQGACGDVEDFIETLKSHEIPIAWTKGARAFHQFHEEYLPPIDDLPALVRNDAIFRGKWGRSAMPDWLDVCEKLGLIERDGDEARILRKPGEEDRRLTRVPEDVSRAGFARVAAAVDSWSVAAQ